ncbi:kinase-like protein [Phlegmacium glaucopus]|nr:kinase-like protein [Phlegmacium glaucopus]
MATDPDSTLTLSPAPCTAGLSIFEAPRSSKISVEKSSLHSPALSDNILNQILQSLYDDFLESDESIRAGEHHCSLLHPCVSISKSSAFAVFYKFRLIAANWNAIFLSTAKLDRYGSYLPVPVPRRYRRRICTTIRKSVIFGRYRVFRAIECEKGTYYRGVFLAYDFGGTGGCKEPRQVVIKAWMGCYDDDFVTESRVYSILSISPMKGFPRRIENIAEPSLCIYAVVLEKLGPSLQDIYRLMPDKRFDEEMTLVIAIQILDRCAALHARGIIYNGIKPANICLGSPSSNATAASTLNLIDFGYSFVRDVPILLHRGPEFSGNKRFWSALSHHGFTQSYRDDLESLGYLVSALYQGSLPWDSSRSYNICHIKMVTPGSTLFRDMDPSFLEYWKDVRSLAYAEVPDYNSLKSRFVQCWERKGFGNSPGQYDWLTLCKRLTGGIEGKESPAALLPLSAAAATSVVAPGLGGDAYH